MIVEFTLNVRLELDEDAASLDEWLDGVDDEVASLIESQGGREISVDITWFDWHEVDDENAD